jgi:hypothetical protein
MQSVTSAPPICCDQIEYVSEQLLPGADLLVWLLLRELCGELSHTEVGPLCTLNGGPRRITDLAELAGLPQLR